jgi:hypothetical protein
MRRTATSRSTDFSRPERAPGGTTKAAGSVRPPGEAAVGETCAVRRMAADGTTRDAAGAEGEEPGTGGARRERARAPWAAMAALTAGLPCLAKMQVGRRLWWESVRPRQRTSEARRGRRIGGRQRQSEAGRGSAGGNERSETGRAVGGGRAERGGAARIGGGWRGDGQGPSEARRGDPFADRGVDKQGWRGAWRGRPVGGGSRGRQESRREGEARWRRLGRRRIGCGGAIPKWGEEKSRRPRGSQVGKSRSKNGAGITPQNTECAQPVAFSRQFRFGCSVVSTCARQVVLGLMRHQANYFPQIPWINPQALVFRPFHPGGVFPRPPSGARIDPNSTCHPGPFRAQAVVFSRHLPLATHRQQEAFQPGNDLAKNTCHQCQA